MLGDNIKADGREKIPKGSPLITQHLRRCFVPTYQDKNSVCVSIYCNRPNILFLISRIALSTISTAGSDGGPTGRAPGGFNAAPACIIALFARFPAGTTLDGRGGLCYKSIHEARYTRRSRVVPGLLTILRSV